MRREPESETVTPASGDVLPLQPNHSDSVRPRAGRMALTRPLTCRRATSLSPTRSSAGGSLFETSTTRCGAPIAV